MIHDVDCESVLLATDVVPFGEYSPCRCVERGLVAPRTFRTGDRVDVVTIGQRGVVRGRKDGRVLVHFGRTDNREVWAWYPAADLVRVADHVEVIVP